MASKKSESTITPYQVCKREKIKTYIKKYENGNLLLRDNSKVKKRKQAIAIALSESNKQCKDKIDDKDIKKMEDRLELIYENNKKFTLTSAKNLVYLVNHYRKEGNHKKADLLQKTAVNYLKKYGINNPIDKKVINELRNLL